MASYKLRFRQSVSRDLRPIPKPDVERILRRIDALADDPRPPGCEKLSGQERYRLRQGNYRILYEIVDDELVVTVVKIGHRRHVYRR
ncbi:type II toxin-antitoxin system RelE/ParE family toxin [Guyparkeria halophila]|uniref:Type II toxin-antitoxin system RelE/ParE family toxin n=1 Tax=Guyparkeria halophila TaxID=47960 RepID=A0ABZ0YYT7_9GAMM|nr:type II toxin-antitoxin system RelE/ParE family toxin [Guyparkeria halophila]WQH17354.1 type II toxin-antitoxin system RelE/ParE family toxin [Guyparkeria halophila]